MKLNINLTKPLAFFDLETTGKDVSQDRIVSLAAKRFTPRGNIVELNLLINPGIPIPKEASDIHGITNEMVKDCPTFDQYAGTIIAFFHSCDIAGYNHLSFDVPLLVEELLRHDFSLPFNDETRYVDSKVIFHQRESRTLSAAVQFYCGETLENAHEAMADVQATVQVLNGQLEKYPDLIPDVNHLHEVSTRDKKVVDFAGKLAFNKDGVIVYTFGKHKDVPVVNALGYANWMLNSDFPLHTKMKLQEIIDVDNSSGFDANPY